MEKQRADHDRHNVSRFMKIDNPTYQEMKLTTIVSNLEFGNNSDLDLSTVNVRNHKRVTTENAAADNAGAAP
ncbi:hypothetical protein FRC00_012474, partial [Tulasnella sp. 408]